ncbi:Xab2 [Phodopus roborovskii]|uniref:Xab2 protein n=1 Tax=Phodopus roborovskii TaxID=109678 RepID=A0AAV0A7E4_PHORO|nr:Xab2 [Phodopus roborovskii]
MVVMARVPRPERPDLVFEEEDLPYEEEIMRNQFSVKCWLRYIEFKQGAPKPRLNQLYERALKLLPCRCIWPSPSEQATLLASPHPSTYSPTQVVICPR